LEGDMKKAWRKLFVRTRSMKPIQRNPHGSIHELSWEKSLTTSGYLEVVPNPAHPDLAFSPELVEGLSKDKAGQTCREKPE